jgi:hypothetical protein
MWPTACFVALGGPVVISDTTDPGARWRLPAVPGPTEGVRLHAARVLRTSVLHICEDRGFQAPDMPASTESAQAGYTGR